MQGHKDILAIQTLRNMIMASNLMATTCMVIVGLLINNLTNENSNFCIQKNNFYFNFIFDSNENVSFMLNYSYIYNSWNTQLQ